MVQVTEDSKLSLLHIQCQNIGNRTGIQHSQTYFHHKVGLVQTKIVLNDRASKDNFSDIDYAIIKSQSGHICSVMVKGVQKHFFVVVFFLNQQISVETSTHQHTVFIFYFCSCTAILLSSITRQIERFKLKEIIYFLYCQYIIWLFMKVL